MCDSVKFGIDLIPSRYRAKRMILKDDLFVISQHYEISVSRALLKDSRACLLAGLIDKGVLPDAELMQQGEPSVAVAGESPVAECS